jgi:hypothetical protein
LPRESNLYTAEVRVCVCLIALGGTGGGGEDRLAGGRTTRARPLRGRRSTSRQSRTTVARSCASDAPRSDCNRVAFSHLNEADE